MMPHRIWLLRYKTARAVMSTAALSAWLKVNPEPENEHGHN